MLVFFAVDALIGFREFKPQRVAATTKKKDARPVFGVAARLDIGIDERRFVPGRVEGELGGVVGANHEFVDTRLGRHERTGPTDCETVGLKTLRIGTLETEIKVHLRINLFIDEACLPIKVAAIEILSPQPVGRFDAGGAVAEAGEEIGSGVLILPDREPGEVDAGGAIAIAGDCRIEGGVDIVGDLTGRVTGDRGGVVFRHGLVDVGGELVDRTVADERLGHVGRTGARVAVATAAVFTVDGQTGVVLSHERMCCQPAGSEASGPDEGSPRGQSDTEHDDQRSSGQAGGHQMGGQLGGHQTALPSIARLNLRQNRAMDSCPFASATPSGTWSRWLFSFRKGHGVGVRDRACRITPV